ncbi:MAG: hypothetical protein ACQEQQ_09045 [Chloroflexota bacterium]
MRLSPPKQIVFWISLILAVLGVLATIINIPFLSGFAVWIVVVGYILLALGNTLTGF